MSTRKRELHGMSRSGTYHTWAMMKQRCYNPKQAAYGKYGGRGIAVCERWCRSFAAFLEDMGERPAGMSLDRIDNDGEYSPENCRWATPKQQMNNTRRTLQVTVGGKKRPVVYVAADLAVPVERVRSRLQKGWTAEEALGLERHVDRRAVTINGESLTAAQWAQRNGLSRQAVAQRIQNGWTREAALTTPKGGKRPEPRSRTRRSVPARGAAPTAVRIGQNILALRRQNDIQQAELAASLGMSAPTLSEIERGLRWPSLPTLAALCAHFNVSAAALLELMPEGY